MADLHSSQELRGIINETRNRVNERKVENGATILKPISPTHHPHDTNHPLTEALKAGITPGTGRPQAAGITGPMRHGQVKHSIPKSLKVKVENRKSYGSPFWVLYE